jgi:hypothetical protein
MFPGRELSSAAAEVNYCQYLSTRINETTVLSVYGIKFRDQLAHDRAMNVVLYLVRGPLVGV